MLMNIFAALWRKFGPKRDDPKRKPEPPATAGPKRDAPK